MRNLRTSKSKYKGIKYFVNRNGKNWEVVEFPTNDVVSTFHNKVDAELLKLYGDNEVELLEISKGYEEIRKMVDHAVIHRVEFK